MILLCKERKPKIAGNFRRITLLNTAYKLYAAVLNEKLKTEIESKEILSDTQAGFRKATSRGTITCTSCNM